MYLGFPIWGETMPPIVRTFLRKHATAGKTVNPFVTHGGYGLGGSMAVLKAHAPDATIDAPFVLGADQERRTMEAVMRWVGQEPAGRR